MVSQLALSLGARVSSRLRERVEALTGPGLALLGSYLLAGELLPSGLLTWLALVIVTVGLGIPAIVAVSCARRGTSPTPTAHTSGGPSSIACGWLTNSTPSTTAPDPDIPVTRPASSTPPWPVSTESSPDGVESPPVTNAS